MNARSTFVAVVFLLWCGVAVAGDSPAIHLSMDSALAEDPQRSVPLEAESTSIEIDVLGSVAVGVVRQSYGNDGLEPVSFTYRSALPSGLRSVDQQIAIDGEAVVVEERRATSKKNVRRSTRPTSKSAAPRSFTLPAGSTADVETVFRAPITFADGRFVFELPAIEAGGWPVASVLAINVHHDEPLILAESPTHEIITSYDGSSTRIEPVGGLVEQKFRFEYAVGRTDDEPDLSGFVGPELENGQREVMLVLSPPAAPRDDSVRPKQVLFVVDTSGSMLQEQKLEEAVAAVRLCLDRLGDEDQLNLVRFATEFEMMGEAPVVADAEGLAQASTWLTKMKRGGSTKLLGALEATLRQPEDSDLHRMVVVITDGNIQDEKPVLELLKAELGEARLFVVGVGQDVRQQTLTRLAEFGRGTAAVVASAEQLNDTITGLFNTVAQPLAWDLGIEAEGVEVVSVEPARAPDLYAGRPVTLRAKVKGGVPGDIVVSAETMEGSIRFATRPATADTVDALKRLR